MRHNKGYTSEGIQAILTSGNGKTGVYCRLHPTGIVKFNTQTGKPWTRCNYGFKLHQECDITSE